MSKNHGDRSLILLKTNHLSPRSLNCKVWGVQRCFIIVAMKYLTKHFSARGLGKRAAYSLYRQNENWKRVKLYQERNV